MSTDSTSSITQITTTSDAERVHPWHHCHNCDARPIIGRRFECESCPAGPDNDLCEPCYELLQKGKIKHPSQDNTTANSLQIKEHKFSIHEGKPITQFDEWFKVKHSLSPEPKLPYPFVVRPVFTAGSDSAIGGYGFVAYTGKDNRDKPILFTALHVMDSIIKQKGIDCSVNNTKYTGQELPAIITDVSIFDVFAPSWMMAFLGTAFPMLVLPDARTDDEEPYSSRDIAAFRVNDPGDIKPAPLALHPPSKGDNIWLVARFPEKPKHQLFKAVVVEITDRSMVFIYETPGEKPQYTSGAPVVNQNGEVVGIIVGGGDLKNQKLGHANHVGNIRAHLLSCKN
jgi:hypothetical protein